MDDQLTTVWLERLVAGDSLAAQRIWQHYYERLIRLARQKLLGVKRRMADEEDVVVVAFNSFFRGVQQGRFPRLEDRDDLWQLLVMLTTRKAIDQMQFENREKRGGGRVFGESSYLAGDFIGDGAKKVVGSEPTPEFALEMAEQIESLLDSLGDDTLRRIALAKLEGFTNQEIAEQMDVGTRTVERKLRLIRTVWKDRAET
jgi:DNA-directed RNA polymerase specialized sigma24 family protein